MDPGLTQTDSELETRLTDCVFLTVPASMTWPPAVRTWTGTWT